MTTKLYEIHLELKGKTTRVEIIGIFYGICIAITDLSGMNNIQLFILKASLGDEARVFALFVLGGSVIMAISYNFYNNKLLIPRWLMNISKMQF